MKIILIHARVGRNVASRHIASQLRDEIMRLNQPVQLDFHGIKTISFCFAEELFGSLAREYGRDIFSSRVRVKNIERGPKSVIEAAIEKSLRVAA